MRTARKALALFAGRRRLKRGVCPECRSDPPVSTCVVCRGSAFHGPDISAWQDYIWHVRFYASLLEED